MKKKIWIIFIVLIISLCTIAYFYIYQDHRNVEKEHPAYTITASSIHSEFLNDSFQSEKKYLNKTVIVFGVVSEINKNDITLNDNVFCLLSNTATQQLKIKSEVKIKGRVIGYDDLLQQIKLDQCVIQ